MTAKKGHMPEFVKCFYCGRVIPKDPNTMGYNHYASFIRYYCRGSELSACYNIAFSHRVFYTSVYRIDCDGEHAVEWNYKEETDKTSFDVLLHDIKNESTLEKVFNWAKKARDLFFQ